MIGHEQKLKSVPEYLAFAVASKSRNSVFVSLHVNKGDGSGIETTLPSSRIASAKVLRNGSCHRCLLTLFVLFAIFDSQPMRQAGSL